MNKQPFWVVTARCDDGNNGWRWWIVCVQTTPEDAARIKAALDDQRDLYRAARELVTAEMIRRRDVHDRAPSPGVTWDDTYNAIRAFEKASLERIVKEIGMLDRRFQWVRANLETPDYEIEESSDDPHTDPDPDDHPEWP